MRRDYISTIKIIVVGNSYTGKTSFVNRWTRGHFSNSYKTTIMSEFGCKRISIADCVYQVQLWDIAGMDRHASVAHLFLKDTAGVIVLSAVNDDDTLYDTLKWKEEIYSKVNEKGPCPMILVQNKSDLIGEESIGEKEEEVKRFSEMNKFTKCFLTSAKTGRGVNEAMNYIIGEIVDEIRNKHRKVAKEEVDDVIRCSKITESSFKEEKRKKCC